MGKNFLKLGLMALMVISSAGCERSFYSDLTDCPQGVEMHFRVVTPCAVNYPKEIQEVMVLAFDEQDKLVDILTDSAVPFDKDYILRKDYYRIGTTSFIAWAGSDLKRYDFAKVEKGVTKQEMMVQMLQLTAERPADAQPLYVGFPAEGTITQEDRSHIGTIYDPLRFDLQQVNYNLTLYISGLRTSSEYDVRFLADNGKYDISGKMLEDDTFRYMAEVEQKEGTLKVQYGMMQLLEGRPYAFEVINKTNGNKVVYSFDLLKDVLLAPHPFVDDVRQYLACNHDFTVHLKLQENNESYMAVMVTIGDWNFVPRVNVQL